MKSFWHHWGAHPFVNTALALVLAFAVFTAMSTTPNEKARAQTTVNPGDPGYDDIAYITVTPENDDTATISPASVKNDPTHTGRHYDASGNCWRTWHGYIVTAVNNRGIVLWWFEDKLHDCVRNGNVVSFTFDDPTHHECWCTLWNWKGWTIDGHNYTKNYVWRQVRGHYKMCVMVAGLGKCFSADPWVYIGGRGDGTFGATGGTG